MMRPSPPSAKRREPMLHAMRHGHRVHRRAIRRCAGSFSRSSSPRCLRGRTASSFRRFAVNVLHAGARGLGWAVSAIGVGGFGGALVTAYFAQRERRVEALAAIRTAHVVRRVRAGFVPTLAFALPVLFAIGVGTMALLGATNTLIQTLSPDDVRGRALSVYTMIAIGVVPLGALVDGAIASAIGLRATFVLAGAVCARSSLPFGSCARSSGRYKKSEPRYVATRLNNSAGITPSGIRGSSVSCGLLSSDRLASGLARRPSCEPLLRAAFLRTALRATLRRTFLRGFFRVAFLRATLRGLPYADYLACDLLARRALRTALRTNAPATAFFTAALRAAFFRTAIVGTSHPFSGRQPTRGVAYLIQYYELQCKFLPMTARASTYASTVANASRSRVDPRISVDARDLGRANRRARADLVACFVPTCAVPESRACPDGPYLMETACGRRRGGARRARDRARGARRSFDGRIRRAGVRAHVHRARDASGVGREPVARRHSRRGGGAARARGSRRARGQRRSRSSRRICRECSRRRRLRERPEVVERAYAIARQNTPAGAAAALARHGAARRRLRTSPKISACRC